MTDTGWRWLPLKAIDMQAHIQTERRRTTKDLPVPCEIVSVKTESRGKVLRVRHRVLVS